MNGINFLRSCIVFLIGLQLFGLPFELAANDEVYYRFEHFSYAGPMAVMQLANDWRGDIKQGDDAISFIENEIGLRKNNFLFGFVSRNYHQFSIGNDLARGFYYYNNNISLDNELRIDASLSARSYSGTGVRLGYEFKLFPLQSVELSLTPSLVALRLDEVIWGRFEGELFYSNNKTGGWGGTIDLDYHYTEDHVVRRPLTGEYLGQLYGLDFDIDLESEWLDLNYSGVNLFSRIYWDSLPTTTAQVSTETAFLLFGYEYFEDVVLNAPALHFVQASGPFPISPNGQVNWLTTARISPIKSFYYHGLQFEASDVLGFPTSIRLGLQYDFSTSTSRFSIKHRSVEAVLASQSLDISKSQQLAASFTFHYLF